MADNLAGKSDYLATLRSTIWSRHNCGATHLQTVPVLEVFEDKTVWNGDVEVFDIILHPKAKRAYAWKHTEREKAGFVVVLEIPPIKDARTAVTSVMADCQSVQSAS